MRKDLAQYSTETVSVGGEESGKDTPPPGDLIRFIKDIRRHSLKRDWQPMEKSAKLPRHIAVGMKVKKVHEVQHFAEYVDRLTNDITASSSHKITHIADFGSGQNYLGRALASQPFNKHIIAIEGRPHNIVGAKEMDVLAGLAPKKVRIVNKKEHRALQDKELLKEGKMLKGRRKAQRMKEAKCEDCVDGTEAEKEDVASTGVKENGEAVNEEAEPIDETLQNLALEPVSEPWKDPAPEGPEQEPVEELAKEVAKATLQISKEGQGSIQYVEHRLEDGNLAPVVEQIVDAGTLEEKADEVSKETTDKSEQPFATTTEAVVPTTKAVDPNLMVISLHSCGNLLHHGLRSLVLNPTVKAVAMIGCCYNLMTERLGPPSYKLPTLRPNHPRLDQTANAFDPHGFPMSTRYATFPLPNEDNSGLSGDEGVRLNITARMMAVQAPQNWGPEDSEAFFTRHFFRALLQRVFLERGVIEAPQTPDDVAAAEDGRAPCSPAGTGSPGQPIIIGTLKKSCYSGFVNYVRGALAKILENPEESEERKVLFRERVYPMTDEEIREFEVRYAQRKKELSVVWSLMAFSAGVIEAMIVVDRWLWLLEQEEVGTAWVEPVFGYGMSPRNLVVVGLKK
ncbi:uncharacterized protein K452DRAFT_289050 [Aplosporella prunicola CBS 121167]|uniref:Methyltransferase domain-containing protein n=1 Tax=Aplosporella prunicola CBS 121167 TaxID=1176127 RepID=A0A6A6B7W7_9PEZI|nr:uncharacterized protein K452DRAFT_289050 [Aplosporella prunicola CBS 121167]KAF2140292.1 hypothetical protein K452DRAFT_289050 [Aplosporella prunicola CBS 121167]